MSTLENTKLEENLFEAFDAEMTENLDFTSYLAEKTLEGLDYYRFCKEGAYDLLDFETIFEKVLKAFYDCEGTCNDIQELCYRVYEPQKGNNE